MVYIFSLVRQESGRRRGREVIRGYYSFTPRVRRHPETLPLFYVATCTTLFRDAAYLGAFIFNTSANSCWLGRLVIPQDTTCRPISRTKVLAITSTSIEGLAPPPREQIHTYTHIYLYIYIYRVYFSDVERRNGGRTHSIPNAFIHTLFFNPPPLSRSRSRSTCGECSHGDYK